MLTLRLRSNKKRADNISHAVCQKDGSRRKTLFGIPRHVGHAKCDDENRRARVSAGESPTDNGSSGMVCPLAFPDDSTCHDSQGAGEHEHEDADAWEAGAKVAHYHDRGKSDTRERKLQQDGLEDVPAKRVND